MPSLNKFQRDWYDTQRDQQSEEFKSLASLFVEGRLSRDKFESGFVDSLKQYYLRLGVVAKNGKKFILRDYVDMGKFVSIQIPLVARFADDLAVYRDSQSKGLGSLDGVLHRSSSYSNGWGIFTRFALPAAIADVLPALPGFDCLGGSACGCFLTWYLSRGYGLEVTWHRNVFKESCILCVDFSTEWTPLYIPWDELDTDLLEEEEDGEDMFE